MLDANNMFHVGNIMWVDFIYKGEHHFINMRHFGKKPKNKTVRASPEADNIILMFRW